MSSTPNPKLNMIDYVKTSHPSVVHTVTETSAKLLAETLIEMGVISVENARAVSHIKLDLQNAEYDVKRKSEELDKLRTLMTTYADKLTTMEKQLKTAEEDMKHLREYSRKSIQGAVMRDVVIEELLKRYKITKADRTRIKKLLTPVDDRPKTDCCEQQKPWSPPPTHAVAH
jgi:predicted  nucleic acid-binding Zn-ribbon protein